MSNSHLKTAIGDLIHDHGLKASIEVLAEYCREQAAEEDDDADDWEDAADDLEDMDIGEI